MCVCITYRHNKVNRAGRRELSLCVMSQKVFPEAGDSLVAHWPRLDYMYILTHSVARRVTLVYANHWGKMDFWSQLSIEHIYLSVKRVYMEIKERECVCVCVCV